MCTVPGIWAVATVGVSAALHTIRDSGQAHHVPCGCVMLEKRVLVTKVGSGWAEDAICAVEHALGGRQHPTNCVMLCRMCMWVMRWMLLLLCLVVLLPSLWTCLLMAS